MTALRRDSLHTIAYHSQHPPLKKTHEQQRISALNELGAGDRAGAVPSCALLCVDAGTHPTLSEDQQADQIVKHNVYS